MTWMVEGTFVYYSIVCQCVDAEIPVAYEMKNE